MRHVFTSAILAVGFMGLLTSSGSAAAVSLYTTQEDFAQWGNTTPVLTTPSAVSYDSSTANGVGNTTAAAALPGTNGGMSVSEVTANNFTYFYGPSEQGNTAFLAALGTTKTGTAITAGSGTVSFTYSQPTPAVLPGGAYFQLNLVMNYSGNFGQFTGGTTTANGDGTFTRTIPYTLNAVANLGYFNLGIIYNTNYGVTTAPAILDNFVASANPAPEPATLSVIAGVGAIVLRRRR